MVSPARPTSLDRVSARLILALAGLGAALAITLLVLLVLQ
jgi:hypothetical protein